MNRPTIFALLIAATLAAAPASASAADPIATSNAAAPAWPAGTLTIQQSLDIALASNPAIRKGVQDLAESQGIALQQKSAILPKLRSTGAYTQVDTAKIETVTISPGGPAVSFANPQAWNANIFVIQPFFAGGKLLSSARSSRLTRDAALANYQALVSDTLLSVRIAYQDILLAAEQITVQEASVHLLEQELGDTRRRFDAGTVPRFNVLRAEVELANAKPRLFRARNALRISKNNLAVLLGFNIPKGTDQDIPLSTADKMTVEPLDLPLADAINRGLGQRPELAALRTASRLREEEVRQAKADYYPAVSGTAGYGWQNRTFTRDLTRELDGWNVGVQLSWDIWDAGLTKGRVAAAKARGERSRIDVDDTSRRIELEVRTAYSTFAEAKEVLESQSRVIEQADEALRLANARSEAGTGTQLDVLSAQTALTEARTTYSVALHDHNVARARLERAVGDGVRLLPLGSNPAPK